MQEGMYQEITMEIESNEQDHWIVKGGGRP